MSSGEGDSAKHATATSAAEEEQELVPRNDAADLTEDDLIRMKSLVGEAGDGRSVRASDPGGDQSIVSLADSASNFDEHVAEEYDEIGEEEQEGEGGEEGGAAAGGGEPQNRIFGGFMFDRQRSPEPELPKETVTVLQYPLHVPDSPDGKDPAGWERAFKEATVYLVGTAHFSKESQEDVMRTIRAVQPDVVMVELCPSRISILSMDEATLLKEAKDLNSQKIMNIIKQSGAVQGLLHVMLLSMSAHITRELSMAPGGEFRAAHRGVVETQLCRLVLGDRPIQITLQRALGSLSLWQKLKFFWHLLCSHNTNITAEDVERCKRADLLEQLLAEMAGDFPKLSEIFVQERDAYMTHALHTILVRNTVQKRIAWQRTDAKWQPVRVVAVVGIGHVPGIVANWARPVDVAPLIEIPQPSAAGKVVKFGIRIAFYGAVTYGVFRAGRAVYCRLA